VFERANIVATIAVSDIERAKKFYGEVLGLKAVEESPAGIRYENASGAGLFVYPSQFAGTNKATYAGFDVEDIQVAVKELRDRRIVFEEYDMPGLKTVDGIAEMEGEKAAWFKDPDGNILSIGDSRPSRSIRS
jgi:catechol 2,3-dioxygenase-like lactoylglutathione lyase family enzyme